MQDIRAAVIILDMSKTEFVDGLEATERERFERRLWERQSKRCFVCDEIIDLQLHKGSLDIDHIQPRTEGGADDQNNYAITHAHCNRSKGASDLRVARRLAELEKLHTIARASGERGANLGHVLARHEGARSKLRMRVADGHAEYSLTEAGDPAVRKVPIFKDGLSGMDYCFLLLPLEYLHHDDRINPRSIGPNVRGLIEEFMKKRPQLHVSLAWWLPDESGAGEVKVFDGQHKAAAQIMLGVTQLPIRMFLNPDTNLLLQANTNAGDKLSQVAFDKAVLRHLGSTLYIERVRQYQTAHGLSEEILSFSERQLANYFAGERRAVERYIVDAVRDSVTHNKDNRLMEFVEWAGKGSERPLSYSTLEKSFFSEFLFQKVLDNPIDQGVEQGENPRFLERDQFVRLMSLFADVFLVGKWNPEIGGYRLEAKLQQDDVPVPEEHVRAARMCREEILAAVLERVRLAIEHYYAFAGEPLDKERLFQHRLPDQLWEKIEAVLRNLSELPCWADKHLSRTVFGAKTNRDYWRTVFNTGKTPHNVPVLNKPLELKDLITPPTSMKRLAV